MKLAAISACLVCLASVASEPTDFSHQPPKTIDGKWCIFDKDENTRLYANMKECGVDKKYDAIGVWVRVYMKHPQKVVTYRWIISPDLERIGVEAIITNDYSGNTISATYHTNDMEWHPIAPDTSADRLAQLFKNLCK